MDDLAKFNKQCWENLARANVQYSRPMLDLTPQSARTLIDPESVMDDPAGRDVLCLAGGGGQQSAAFALLGARVTVLDLCETQLERDRLAAKHYGVAVRTVQGDMRDLSALPAGGFDLVYHAHSLAFVPDAGQVFDQVVGVLRPGGQYHVSWADPVCQVLVCESWTGQGYLFNQSVVDGRELTFSNPYWTVDSVPGQPPVRVVGPREFTHTVPAMINGLIRRGFSILGLWESGRGDPTAAPGTWRHMASLVPPNVTIWARRGSA